MQKATSFQDKRKAFTNQIRQQQRDAYRQKLRHIHFNFLTSIGVINHSEQTHMLNFIIDEQESIRTQQHTSENQNYEEMLQREMTEIYFMIHEYKMKDFGHQIKPAEYWTKLKKQVGSFIEDKALKIKDNVSWEAIEQDLESMLNILSKEIFIDSIEWSATSIIDSQGLRLITSWIVKIFAILGNDYKEFTRILELSNVIVELLINFELKLQKVALYQLRVRNAMRIGKAMIPWQNRQLFEKILTLPFAYKKWSTIEHCFVFETYVYSLILLGNSIRSKLEYLIDSKTTYITDSMQQLLDLIYSYNNLFYCFFRRGDLWKSLQNQTDQYRRDIVQLIIVNAQQVVQNGTKVYTSIERSHPLCLCDLSGTLSQTIIQLLYIEHCSEKPFLHHVKCEGEVSEIVREFNQTQAQLLDQIKKSKVLVSDNNHRFLFDTITESLMYNKKTIRDFRQHYLTSKLQNVIDLIIWTHSLAPMSLNENKETKETALIQQITEDMKRRVLSKLMLRVESSFERENLLTLFTDQAQQIISLDHLQQILFKANSQQHKLTHHLLTFIQYLFLSFQAQCQALQILADTKPKTEQLQRLQAMIICQLHQIVKVVNQIAFCDEKALVKHGFLLAQLTGFGDMEKETERKSVVEWVVFLYSHLTNGRSGNYKDLKIKNQLGYFCQNIAYSCFPLRSHFDQLNPQQNEESTAKTNILIKSIQQSTKQNHSSITTISPHQLEYILSQKHLDHQTDLLLQLCCTLMNESIIESILSGIKICDTILIQCPNVQLFRYFKNFIKSSTKIALKLQELSQEHEHDTVKETALLCINDLEEGEGNYGEEQGSGDVYQEKDVEI